MHDDRDMEVKVGSAVNGKRGASHKPQNKPVEKKTTARNSSSRHNGDGQRAAKLDRIDNPHLEKIDKTIGRTIAAARVKMRNAQNQTMTRPALAEKLSIDKNVLGLIERGEIMPTEEQKMKLEQALQIKISVKKLDDEKKKDKNEKTAETNKKKEEPKKLILVKPARTGKA